MWKTSWIDPKDWATAPRDPNHHIAFKPAGVSSADDRHVSNVMNHLCKNGRCKKGAKRPDMSMGEWSKRFQIRPVLDNTYAVYVSDHQDDSRNNIVKLNRENMGDKSWFIYDYRSHSIRLADRRDLALSNSADGSDFLKTGLKAVFRQYKNEVDQAVKFEGKRIINT